MFKTLSYTASTMIVSEGKVLLHMHAKFHTWLQVGGHIEANESPHQAALREVFEEAGITVALFQNHQPLIFPKLETTIKPMYIRLIDTDQEYQFLDFLYYATLPQCVSIQQTNSQFRWFTSDELASETSIKPDVRYFGLDAIAIFSVK